MKSINVDNDVLELHNKALLQKNAVYPLVESSVNFASIPANLKTINVQGISQGTITFYMQCLLSLKILSLFRNSTISVVCRFTRK